MLMGMAFPNEAKIGAKHDKIRKYQQLCFELRDSKGTW